VVKGTHPKDSVKKRENSVRATETSGRLNGGGERPGVIAKFSSKLVEKLQMGDKEKRRRTLL